MSKNKDVKPEKKDEVEIVEETIKVSPEKQEVNSTVEKKPNVDLEKKPDTKPKKKNEVDMVYPSVPLKVFCSLSGLKPDQIAGFQRYAITNKLGPMTITQWRETLVGFQNKPTR